MKDSTKPTVEDARKALKAATGLSITMKQIHVVFPGVRRGDALPLNMTVDEFIAALAENGELDLSPWLATRPAASEVVNPPVATDPAELPAEGGAVDESSDAATDVEPPAEGGSTDEPAVTDDPAAEPPFEGDEMDGAIGGLHSVAGFGSAQMAEPVAASLLVAEWDLSLEDVFSLAGFDKPGRPETLVDAAVVRAAYEARAQFVAPVEPATGATLATFNPKAAFVAPSGFVRRTSADRDILAEIFKAVQLMLTNLPYRPFDTIEEVRDGAGNVIGYKVPSLLDPTRTYRVEPMQYWATHKDPTAGFAQITEPEMHALVARLSELSTVPKACQNCGQGDAFHLRLQSKLYALLAGIEKSEGGEIRYLHFFLPGMEREWKALYKSLGWSTASNVFQPMGFRKVHDECGIIAHVVRLLVGSPDFQDVDWYDVEVRGRFMAALGAELRPRMAEIKAKTRGEVGSKTVRQRAGGILKVLFDELDAMRANREAGTVRANQGASND